MGEVNGLVTQTALAIRDEDELEVAASILDAALRRAKAEVLREVRNEFDSSAVGLSLDSVEGSSNTGDYYAAGHSDAYREVIRWIDARAAQIEEGE